MAESQRVCTSCHTPLPDAARFCLACGAPTPVNVATLADPGSDVSQLDRLRAALADRYAVERVLGQGGMATVYVARDLKHNRKVAIKVLRPELAAALGSERFLREIQVIAQLHHPNILMLIDSGEADGVLFYVMPFVEGESLRTRLARERELPVTEAVRIVRDVADALAYAHGHGVVHRDIKPDNILMAGRHALVADFGVAKAVSQATSHGKVTTAGVALGTPAYMAPEQAVGDQATDHRADIYALGIVAYELLTGAPPFRSVTPQALLSAHVTERPVPVDQQRPAIPPALAAVIMRCLEKHAADRWQSAEELRAQLELFATPSVGMTPTSARLVSAPGRRLSRRAGLGILAVAVVGIGVVALWRRPGHPAGPSAPAARRQVTYDGTVSQVEISPDGKSLAYVDVAGDTNWVEVRDLAGGSPVRVWSAADVLTLRWSPDGSSIYVSGKGLDGEFAAVVLPRLGGAARNVECNTYAAWSSDGTRLLCWNQAQKSEFWITVLGTTQVTEFNPPDTVTFKYGGDWSPSGNVAIIAMQDPQGRSVLWSLDVGAHTWHQLRSDSIEMSVPRFSPDGDAAYYLRGGVLYRLRIRSDGSARGEPVAVQSGIDASDFSLSRQGGRLVFTHTEEHSHVWAGRLGAGRPTLTRLTEGTARRALPVFSPDGAWVAYREQQGQMSDLFVAPVHGGHPHQVTTSGQVISGPAWAPDGKTLALIARVEGQPRVEQITLGGEVVRVFSHTEASEEIAWEPGARILYQRPGNHNFNLLDPETTTETPLVANSGVGWMFGPVMAADGGALAVDWNRSPTPGVWTISLRSATQQLLMERGMRGTVRPIGWAADGRAVYVRRYKPDDIALVPVAGAPPRQTFPVPVENGECSVRDSRAGTAIACVSTQSVSDAWMIEGYDRR